MLIKYIERKERASMLYKFTDEFESDEEICKSISSGLVSYFLSDKTTFIHDNFTLNVIEQNIPIITDVKGKVIVAKGYNNINSFLQSNNLVAIIDVLELEN